MSTSKIIKNTIYYGVVPKLSMLVSIFILPMTTAFLTPYDYGIQGVVSSYTGLLSNIAPLGLHLHLTNSYFELKQKHYLVWGRIVALFLITGLIFGLLNCSIIYFTLPKEPFLKQILICVLGSMPVFLFGNLVIASHIFPLVERPKPLVFTNLAASIAGILTSFVLICYFKLGYWGLIANSAVWAVIGFVLYIPLTWKKFNFWPIFEFKKKRLISFLKPALPLIPHSMGFVLLTSSARIVMSWYNLDYDDIGLYSHGCTMGDYIVVVTTALVTALSPYMQKTFRANDFTGYRKLYYLCQSTALVASFIICIWMNDIYGVLIRNDNLKLSSSIACLMCFAQVQMPLYNFMSVSCFVERKTKQLLWLVFLPGMLNIVLCLILIPIFGYRVAAYTTMFSYWSQILIPFFVPYFKNKTKDWLGARYKLGVLYGVIILALLSGNVVARCGILIKLFSSFAALAVFLFYYFKSKVNRII